MVVVTPAGFSAWAQTAEPNSNDNTARQIVDLSLRGTNIKDFKGNAVLLK
jgi:hypothetical protein